MSNWFPACFTSTKQWEEWRKAARLTAVGLDGYCTDCTPEYQAEMKATDRCLHPKTGFALDEDELIAGVRDKSDKPAFMRKTGSGGSRPPETKLDKRLKENAHLRAPKTPKEFT